jgi:uncharacterized protein
MSNPSDPVTITLALGPSSGMTAQAQRNREALLKAYQDYIAGNTNALFDILDPDVRFREAASLPYGCDVRGRDAAMQGVAGMMQAWSSMDVVFEEFVAAGDLVIAYMQAKAVARATGRRYEGPCAEVFRFRNGRVIEWHPIYWDTHAVRAACGLTESTLQ